MRILYGSIFKKNFKKRVPRSSQLEARYKTRIDLFIKNRKGAILKDHKLIGKRKGYRAFSITGDVRIVYYEDSSTIVTFIDIGTHNQVYK